MNCFTLFDLLYRNLNSRPEHPALVADGAAVTYGQLAAAVDGTAAWLLAAGVRRRDRVGIYLPKSVEEVVATLAIARLGGVFVNVNYQWTIDQLAYMAEDCDIQVLVTDARRVRQIIETGQIDRFRRVLAVGGTPAHPKVAAWADRPQAAAAVREGPIGADLAALLYTSGSTGKPKGVMVTHDNLIDGARSVATYLKNTPDERVLSVPPFSFDYGLNQLTTMLLVGGTLVLQRSVMPAEIVRTAVEQRVTGLPLVAPSWVQVVRYLQDVPTGLPHLRYLTNTGGKIPAAVLQAMPQVFPNVDIYLMYGLTEAFRSTYLPPELFRAKCGAIGRAIPNVEIFVVDPVKGICGPGEQGELIHRGALISRGYWGNRAATDEKLRVNAHLAPLLGEEKVLHSGDLVRRDEDGILWFIGRGDSMIKCSGFRISPTEVEDTVAKHEGVMDVVAFGVGDDELGQVVHIAVAPHNGALEADGLTRFCREHMPSYMVPRAIHLMREPMPRTSSGKIDRPAVIRRFAPA